MWLGILLFVSIFTPSQKVVIPHTQITHILPSNNGIYLKIDGEWALYKLIQKNVFVRKTPGDTTTYDKKNMPVKFKFDLNADGKFETIVYKKSTLSIFSPNKKPETFEHVNDFLFYDADFSGTPDLFIIDSTNTLLFFKNKYHTKNIAIVKGGKDYKIAFITGKKTYTITVYTDFLRGYIPLKGWDRVFLLYNDNKIPLKRGKVVDIKNIENPINSASYHNDTLQISISLTEGEKYLLALKKGQKTLKIAEGTLPRGAFRFEYYVGELKKGIYTLTLKLGQNTYTRDIIVR